MKGNSWGGSTTNCQTLSCARKKTNIYRQVNVLMWLLLLSTQGIGYGEGNLESIIKI